MALHKPAMNLKSKRDPSSPWPDVQKSHARKCRATPVGMTGGGFGARGRAIRILDVAEVCARGIDRRSRCTREKKKERRQDALTGQASVTKCKQILRFTRDDDVGVRS